MNMIKQPKPDRRYLLYLAGIMFLAGMFYFNLLLIRPLVSMESFAVEWSAVRGFLVDGQDPYLNEAFQAASVTVPAKARDNLTSYHEPFYRAVTQFPIGLIPSFDWAIAARLSFIEIALAIIITIIYLSLPWKGEKFQLGLVFLLLLAWPPLWENIRTGDSTLLNLMWILLSFWALSHDMPEIGGVTMALGTSNFEIFGLAVIAFLLWVIYKREWRFLSGFLMTIGLLFILAHIFNPDWYIGYLGSQIKFWQNNELLTSMKILVGGLPATGSTISNIIAVVILALLLYEWHTIAGRDNHAFLWILAFSLAAPSLLGLGTEFRWFAVNLLGIYTVILRTTNRWGKNGFWLAFLLFATLEILIYQFRNWFDSGGGLLIMSAIMILMLYWVRWDSTRTTRLWADILEEKGRQ